MSGSRAAASAFVTSALRVECRSGACMPVAASLRALGRRWRHAHGLHKLVLLCGVAISAGTLRAAGKCRDIPIALDGHVATLT